MKRLFRSLVYNYRQSGLLGILGRVLAVASSTLWSRSIWAIYEHDLPGSPCATRLALTSHRVLGFDELCELGYPKALAFPEDIRLRLTRGHKCHGFLCDGVLATIGWTSSGALELDRTKELKVRDGEGLYDFMTFPRFQSKGFYTDALCQLVVLAGRDGKQRAWIAVDPRNTPSIRGIERAGFRRISTAVKIRLCGIVKFKSEPVQVSHT